MTTLAKPRFTPDEYLALERAADYRSEYVAGQIYAMAGASRRHNLIAGNVFGSLHGQLRGRSYEVYMSDMRVKLQEGSLYTYPDIVAVCGEIRFDDAQKDTLLNPMLVVEVLSDSTEAWDRGGKFAAYRRLESVREYVLISQDRVCVERFERQGEQWVLTESTSLEDTVSLTAIGCNLMLRDVYEKVEFDSPGRPDVLTNPE